RVRVLSFGDRGKALVSSSPERFSIVLDYRCCRCILGDRRPLKPRALYRRGRICFKESVIHVPRRSTLLFGFLRVEVEF
ncbi:hypothetical protein TIFTF001_047974, partial [Ficus carica]